MKSKSSKGDPSKPAISQIIPISRSGFGTKGYGIRLCANHVIASFCNLDVIFHQYNVILKDEDDQPVNSRGISRKVMDKWKETYAYIHGLANMSFADDGENNLFTVVALQHASDVFNVVIEGASSSKTTTNRTSEGNGSLEGSDLKRMRRHMQENTFKVELSWVRKYPLRLSDLIKVLIGDESDRYQDVLRVLNIILRQRSVKHGCLLVRRSFVHNFPSDFKPLGGGVMGCTGYHSSFQPTQSGLSLNIDVSTTMIVQPGPVIKFLLSNQNVDEPHRIDWSKAKRSLKNLRIKIEYSESEFKITGLSEKSCYQQTFPLKQTNDNGSGTVEVTVYDYFQHHRGIKLTESADFPCLNVGKPKRPIYIPIELCHLVSLQRYTKALTRVQRSSLVQSSRQKPSERKLVLSSVLQRINYNYDDMLKKCGIWIGPEFAQVDGRILPPPKLKAGGGRDITVNNGRWNFNNDSFIQAQILKRWAVVNFSAPCDARDLAQCIVHCGKAKGMQIYQEGAVIKERHEMRREPAADRVDAMFQQIWSRFPSETPTFLLCVLPDRKNCDIYGPWKRKCLVEHGVFTQCLAPPKNTNDHYITNALLKLNTKLGGLNSLLQTEEANAIPLVSRDPTIIFGMHVSHGSPGSNVPSVAAVVSSLGWPRISRYRASVCTQEPRQQMIGSLFKMEGNIDRGIIRELIEDFRSTSIGHLPKQIIIFRNGVGESQFIQVLNVELAQIIEACKFLDESWSPKFTVIVAQKNHHTRFFLPKGGNANVPAGTVVDQGVCHPRNYDFYMCAHAGMTGTTRPTRYQVLHDEIGFSPDGLQELVHSLSYVYQRSTSAISVVAPLYYAKLAAAQVRNFVDDMPETASSASDGPALEPELIRLHENVRSSMFFC